MTRIVIRTLGDLQRLRQKFRTIPGILPELQKTGLERAADQTILSAIHKDMENNDFDKKIIEHTNVGEIMISGKIAKVHFISDYVSDSGFDVSKGREEGTRDHDVFAKPGGWLTFIDPITKKRVFRKHTHPSGIERLLIIETNVKKGKQNFLNEYKNNIVTSLNQAVR